MAVMVDSSVFVDTNVLVYTNVAESPLNQIAITTLEQLYEHGIQLWISRQILREYLAVVTRPQIFSKPQPISVPLARIKYYQEHFLIAEDDSRITEKLSQLLEQISIGGKQIHDANIVATMQAYNIPNLLTHNIEDFTRFSEFITILPLDSEISIQRGTAAHQNDQNTE